MINRFTEEEKDLIVDSIRFYLDRGCPSNKIIDMFTMFTDIKENLGGRKNESNYS